MRKLRQKVVKHLLVVTKLVGSTEFEPRSVVSRPNLLNPCYAAFFIEEDGGEEEVEEEEWGDWGRRRR